MSAEKKLAPNGPSRIKIHVSRNLGLKPYLQYYDEEGRRQRIYTGLSDPKTYEGRVKLAERSMLAFIETYVAKKPIEARAWDWIAQKKKTWRKKSYLCYCSKLRLFLKWKGKREMSTDLVTDYFEHLEDHVARGTRNDYLRYLKQIFAAITDDEFFSHIPRLKHKALTNRRYQTSHRRAIYQHLSEHDPELLFACQCVFYLLLRPGSELRLMKVMHFELDEWRVHVPSHISKNGEDDYVVIPVTFREELAEYLSQKQPGDFLFPGRDKKKPIGVNTLAGRYREHLNHLGFGLEFKLYGWKNTANYLLADKKVSLLYIQKQNRHANLETTSIYLSRIGWKDMGSLAEDYPTF
jgi:hypothetical protein